MYIRLIISIFFICLLFSCKRYEKQSTKGNTDYFAEMQKSGEEANKMIDKARKLFQKLEECLDSNLFNEAYAFKRYFSSNVASALHDRRSDLLLCLGEDSIRYHVDTIHIAHVKLLYDTVIVSRFIKNGFNKIIEADLNYYDQTLNVFTKGGLLEYSDGIMTNLKGYWLKRYKSNMSLVQVLTIFSEIRKIISENEVTIFSHMLKKCK